MILTVAQTYVSNNNRYANGFVHARVKSYIANGLDAEVYVLQNKKKDTYVIDNVKVRIGKSKQLADYINTNTNISSVCFHFLNLKMIKAINLIERDIPIIIFVHGNEALWWFERIFPDRFNGLIRTLKFIKYVGVNSYSILKIRRFFKYESRNIHIVCVSKWMAKVAEKNWKLNIKKEKIHIIPNIVNSNIFPYTKKDPELRYNILMLRNFTSGKYALDVAMDTIVKLSTHPLFYKINITIIGDGWLFEKYTSKVSKFKNVKIIRTLLPQEEIKEWHSKNGIFLCPTRQDAQGVSMCEAMSSGLVPITSDNTAIPEFLPKEYNLALNNSDEMAQRIIELINSPNDFIKLSEEVSKYINSKCSKEQTTDKEIHLMSLLSKSNKIS